MAKSNQIMSLDNELIEKLRKEPNKSGLINDLLKEHYNQQDSVTEIIIKEKIKNNKKLITQTQKENKQLQTQMKKIIKKNIQVNQSHRDLDKKNQTIKDKRTKERQRAREFELYVQKNKINLPKLEFHTLMHKYAEETKDPITKFMNEHKGIK